MSHILFSTALRAELVAKLVILGIYFSLIYFSIKSSTITFLILALGSFFLTTSYFTAPLSLHKLAVQGLNLSASNSAKSYLIYQTLILR